MLTFILFLHFAFNETTLADSLRASLVKVDITPPIGVPLAGFGGSARRAIDFTLKYPYATHFKPSIGLIDPIYARILLLEKDRKHLIFVSFDLVGVSRQMRDDLLYRLESLQIQDEELHISATHTHSGPGTFSDNWLMELIGADKFQPEIYDQILSKVHFGVRTAYMNLQPAKLFAYSFQARDIQKNRRRKEGHFDPSANVLLVRNLNRDWLGGMVNLPVHPTALGGGNLMYSADVTGGIVNSLESYFKYQNKIEDPIFLFINGAEGDVSPTYRGTDGIHHLGQSFAQQTMNRLADAREIGPEWNIQSTWVKLGLPAFGMKACMKVPFLGVLVQSLGPLVSTAFPTQTRIWSIQLGDMRLMTWPGEANTSLGLELKKRAHALGAGQSWVMGLTNDYLSYFTSPAEFQEGLYESCNSLYGPQGGMKIIRAHEKMLKGKVAR